MFCPACIFLKSVLLHFPNSLILKNNYIPVSWMWLCALLRYWLGPREDKNDPTNGKQELGSLRLRVCHTQDHVFPSSFYDPLRETVLDIKEDQVWEYNLFSHKILFLHWFVDFLNLFACLMFPPTHLMIRWWILPPFCSPLIDQCDRCQRLPWLPTMLPWLSISLWLNEC